MDDMLSSILNDPEKLQSAISMASSILGGSDSAEPAPDASAMAQQPPQSMPSAASSTYDPSAELMQRAMPVIAEIAKSGQNAVSREKLNLLNAVKPFVADNVSTQIDHGLRLVSIARMANAAMKQFGAAPQEGDTHV